MYWNRKIECMPREELKELQFTRLKTLVDNLYSNNRFYHDKMKAAGVLPGDLTRMEDISKLPFMHKQDLRDNYPAGMFTVPATDMGTRDAVASLTGKTNAILAALRAVGIIGA